jgi:hypothetical protein
VITVSTMSETEATAAARALGEALPPAMGYEVYLRGQLRAGRETDPARRDPGPAPETGKWGAPAEERSG